ncbi:hypothetical protein ACFY41_24565 [Streptomyces syringium]|uniref:hypothetical protein n=1 Tax=Streptomyces syringium TaxID=76729 RepID=UPI003681C08F
MLRLLPLPPALLELPVPPLALELSVLSESPEPQAPSPNSRASIIVEFQAKRPKRVEVDFT